MKQIAAVILLLSLLSCSSVSHTGKRAIRFAGNPVVAHRGAWKKNMFPENSIAAVQQAVQLQCTGSEFDIWMTADDSLVINHDPVFNNHDIERTEFEVLRQNRLSNGEYLPTLRDYLIAGMTNNHSTRLVLEIKPSRISKERGEQVAGRVVQLVQALKAQAWAVYISFDYAILKKIHALDNIAATQYLNGDISPAQLAADGINGADYHYSVFQKNPQWITDAKKNKIVLNAWTVNDTAIMNWLLDNGFSFITTNEPELLFDVLKKRSR